MKGQSGVIKMFCRAFSPHLATFSSDPRGSFPLVRQPLNPETDQIIGTPRLDVEFLQPFFTVNHLIIVLFI